MKLTKSGFPDPISSQIPCVGLPTTAIDPINSVDVSDTVPAGHWPKRGHSTSATKRHRFGFGESLSAGRQGSLDGEASRVPQFQSPNFRLGHADTWRRFGPRESLTTRLEKPTRNCLRNLALHRQQDLRTPPKRCPRQKSQSVFPTKFEIQQYRYRRLDTK